MMSPRRRKPRLAVFKLASCGGCQLALLHCEDALLSLAEAVEIAHFPEATSVSGRGPYDIALVEGSVTTPEDASRIQEIRRSARILVTLGACATAGGSQALRNWRDVRRLAAQVYPRPDEMTVLDRATPVASHVVVDFELRGCPVEGAQILETLGALREGREPSAPTYAVCVECKERGSPCVLVASGIACLGPVTRAGCGALCPSFGRGCYGCFGPQEAPATAALSALLSARGASDEELVRAYRSFNAFAEPFRHEGEARERRQG
jgi:coenzyme F420-reducing hydrogenase gamma subunit